ncbi:hypothetical protein QOZ80_4BG0356740 [Eleusine coracana subsp. coracana]|nr:hypothetical protein QOZ80_4BG0356740 [Eleusine coracana subsp. coracana]
MALPSYYSYAIVFLVSIAVRLSPSFAASSLTTTVRAGYYLAADARLRPLAALDASLYTHLYYVALPVDPTTRASPVVPADPDQARLLAAFSSELKSRNPALRTLLSVGAADLASSSAPNQQTTEDPAFAAMAADPSSRASFAAAAVSLAEAHGFDGLDLAWRYPSSAAEMASLGLLLADLRAAAPRGFLLTAAVYFSDHVFASPHPGVDYPAEAMARCLDWANVVAFGLRPGPPPPNATTAFDAPLYDRASHFSASYGVVSWADAGLPAANLLMGLPLYGRSWVLRNKAHDDVGAPVVAAGPKQRRGTNATGVMSYAEVQRLAAAGKGSVVTTTNYDNASVASYLSVGGVWVAFDGAAVVDEKLAFAARRGMLGYFLWPVNYDDANFTVSRREAWMKNIQQVSSNSRNNGTVGKQAQEPVRVPPALQSPARTPCRRTSSFLEDTEGEQHCRNCARKHKNCKIVLDNFMV